MIRLISFIAIGAFALSVSSAEAAKKKPPETAASAPVQNSSGPKKASYGRRMQTNFGPGCKMSGNC
jgi:hypothetical protein